MLCISRKEGESFMIGDDVEVRVTRTDRNGSVHLAIAAPKEVRILRRELYLRTNPDGKTPLRGGAPKNVWVGATIENEAAREKRHPALMAIPAPVHFWSVEPMLGPLNCFGWQNPPDWVICGGESGPNARPMHPDWARSLRDQCATVGVALFFKQWGEWKPTLYGGAGSAEFLWIEHGQPWQWMCKVGKANAGRLLDGKEHNEFPQEKPV
jgi:carbon storage regulator CsrA